MPRSTTRSRRSIEAVPHRRPPIIEAAHLSESLFMSAEKVNAAHLSASAWAQDVAPVKSAC